MKEFEEKIDKILLQYDAFFVSEQAMNNGRGLAKQQLKTLFTEYSKQLLEDIRGYGERGGHDVYCRTIGEELLNRLNQLSKRNK